MRLLKKARVRIEINRNGQWIAIAQRSGRLALIVVLETSPAGTRVEVEQYARNYRECGAWRKS